MSPDDLLAAIKLFPEIRVPFSLRQFGNGVLVVQSASHSDEQALPFHLPCASCCLARGVASLWARFTGITTLGRRDPARLAPFHMPLVA